MYVREIPCQTKQDTSMPRVHQKSANIETDRFNSHIWPLQSISLKSYCITDIYTLNKKSLNQPGDSISMGLHKKVLVE